VTGAAACFYFDLQSPLAYIAAERVLQVLPGPAEWRPVLARELPGADTFDSFRCLEEQQIFRAELQRRADVLGMQPLRWPQPFPFDSALAMRVSTYAASIGRAVAFAQAAFRQAFAGGRNLELPDNVLIAAAACELHPKAVEKAMGMRSFGRVLRRATEEAVLAGVRDVPAVRVGDQVFCGERAIEEGAERLRAAQRAPASQATLRPGAAVRPAR
jgi:2-hydroxychromene-2-carboxylate isomerase